MKQGRPRTEAVARIVEMAREVLRELGLSETEIDDALSRQRSPDRP